MYSIVPGNPGPCNSVHIKLLMSSVIFSHNIRRHMVYRTYAKFAYRTTGRFRNLKIFIDHLHFMGHTDDW